MTKTKILIMSGGLVTLIVFMLIPSIFNEVLQQNGSVWRKLNYLTMPLFIALMWHQILRSAKKEQSNKQCDIKHITTAL